MARVRVTSFGKILRERRIAKGYSLRKFAELVGLSPTYLSQVEQSKFDPPTAERLQHMAELLGENPDKWIGLAGRIPADLPEIIQKHTEVCDLLRAVKGLTVAQLRMLCDQAEQMKHDQRRRVVDF